MHIETVVGKDFSAPNANYKPLNPRQEVLPAGSVKEKGRLALPCDIIVDYDVAIPLRDGVTIYADIYRPRTDTPVPLLIGWAVFGKGGTGFFRLDNPVFPRRFGVPKAALSGYEAWEAPDPAYWCNQGYAIAQVDARGVFNSEGQVRYQGKQEAEDGVDTIEYLATLPWCNGKVGLTGNSWLAIQQWHIAAQRPAHLAAIAPWEGLDDLLRDTVLRGGIPDPEFALAILDEVYSKSPIENPAGMLATHPDDDEYWRSKRADVEKIVTPAYVVGSYTNVLHTDGTFDAWRRMTGERWLRVHNTHEWPDYYEDAVVEDLRKFFDHYLKGIDNGWEKTPRIRLAVLDPGHDDELNRVEDAFPPARTAETTYFLDATTMKMSQTPPTSEASAEYHVQTQKDQVNFTYTFDQDTEIFGFPRIHLFVEAVGHDDMDIYVTLKKKNKRGSIVMHQPLTLGIPASKKIVPLIYKLGVKAVKEAFFVGAEGMMRASRRELDSELSTPDRPVLKLKGEKKLAAGEVVEVTVPIWPLGMRWHAGESLVVCISARRQRPPALPYLPLPPIQQATAHRFHTGPAHPARLIVNTTSA